MGYLNIIEENFTKSDYVAYLRGSILMWLLEDKPLDIPQFKLYANKLSEVLEEPQSDTTDDECHCLQTQAPEPMVDPDEPKVQPNTIDEPRAYEFKIGDRVVVSKDTEDERTGTIIRLPRDNSRYQEYIVDLDDKALGWEATIAKEGVSCKNAWYGCKGNMTLLEPSIKGSLEVGKWYHTTDFTVEELSKLLPSETTIETEKEVSYNGIETTPPTKTVTRVVNRITTSAFDDKALIEVTQGNFLKEWFKLQEDL